MRLLSWLAVAGLFLAGCETFESTEVRSPSQYDASKSNFAGETKEDVPYSEDPLVKMTTSLQYEPRTIEITAGQTVTWKNTSGMVHTVTFDAAKAQDKTHVELPEDVKPFDSGNIAVGKSFRHTFETPGTYRYFCIPHEGSGMIGEVIVKPAE